MTDCLSTYRVRRAVHADVDALVALDQNSNPYPWPESHVVDALATRHNWLVETQVDGPVVAWLTASSIIDQAELELIVTHADYRRQGLAKRLMHAWLRWCVEQKMAEALLEVRASNDGAIALYQACEFVVVGQRKNYYSVIGGGSEAACLMTRYFKN